MSLCVIALAIAIASQVAADDRYGEPAADFGQLGRIAEEQSPSPPASKNAVSPPPFARPEQDAPPATNQPRTAEQPRTTEQDYGYGVPASRPSAPPVATIPSKPAASVKPSAMMRAMLTAPRGSRLTGRPVSLEEVVAGTSSRREQSRRIDAYWDLCSSVADYYLGVREQDELQRLRSTMTKVGPAWQQAESETGVRLGTSQRAAVASQNRLASLMGSGADGANFPLPTDPPHCGDYYARYDQVFAGRQSPEAQQLSELLPMRFEELTDAALGVTRAEEFLDAIAAQRNAGGDGTGTLRALELLALRRRAFVQIARDYNRRIARYTELASPGEIGADRLIGMLIKRDAAPNTATRPENSAPPRNRQSQATTQEATQATFAEGWEPIKSAKSAPRDENVRPAAGEVRKQEPRREHSLLVPSR